MIVSCHSIFNLPSEVIQRIIQFGSVKDLARVAKTCTLLKVEVEKVAQAALTRMQKLHQVPYFDFFKEKPGEPLYILHQICPIWPQKRRSKDVLEATLEVDSLDTGKSVNDIEQLSSLHRVYRVQQAKEAFPAWWDNLKTAFLAKRALHKTDAMTLSVRDAWEIATERLKKSDLFDFISALECEWKKLFDDPLFLEHLVKFLVAHNLWETIPSHLRILFPQAPLSSTQSCSLPAIAQIAVKKGHAETVRMFLKMGVIDLHQPFPDSEYFPWDREIVVGSGLLGEASREGHPQIVLLLLEAGANVDTFHKGDAPLHHAAKAGHIRVVELLLQARAKLDIQNRQGKTPIQLAEAAGHQKVVEFLYRAASSFVNLDWLRLC